ncbi:MAG: FemAB family PEP-CTERM system-associated protein [Deferribacteres bacterium]|nr:FemAB family PEP-CTERM system-associated protein [candidate division KSB1 bacterium]MCB9510850.1 FemAB family PEP-CTERM system-associated protein [Deferribacteres bacterium]
MITIEKTDFGSEAVNKYIETAADGTIYHHSNILRAIHDTFGHQTVSLAAKNQTGVIGTVPLVHMNSRLFGNFLISVPFFNYGGVCADNDEARQALIDAAVDEARIRDCVHLELRHTHRQFEKLQHKQAKVAMLLDLPESEEELWSGFKSKLRSQIRKPEKEGVTTKVGRLDLVDDFYHVFSMNMRDLGTPVYTKKLFINVLNAFPKSSWIIAAYKDDLPLAAGFLLGFRNTIEIPWASSLREYNRLAANMLVYWQSLKVAIENGFKIFDFGRSTPGEGTYKFKAQWGAEPLDLNWEYWLPEGQQIPDISPKNDKYQKAIRLWQKLPVPLTKVIGPSIVRNIP